jgi:hypothetical protein
MSIVHIFPYSNLYSSYFSFERNNGNIYVS